MKKILQKYILYYLLMIPVGIIWMISAFINKIMQIAAYVICLITNNKEIFDNTQTDLLTLEVNFYNSMSFNNKAEIKIEELES